MVSRVTSLMGVCNGYGSTGGKGEWLFLVHPC
jgi:hypothetical protein